MGSCFQEIVVVKEIMISTLDRSTSVDKFCYLGYVIGAGGGAEEAS